MRSRPLTTGPSAGAVTRLLAVARAAALFATAIGVLVLVGWFLDARLLMQVLPGQVAMVPNTAIGLLFASLAVWLRASAGGVRERRGTRIAAAAAGLLGLITLVEYAAGRDFGIDELLFRDPAGLTGAFPGRMAVVTAAAFAALAAALLLADAGRAWWIAEGLAVLPGLFAMISLAGYVYGVPSIHWIGSQKGMAVHTASAFFALSLGVLFSSPNRGIARLIASDTAGGLMARRVLPIALGVPLLIGWLRVAGQRAGLYAPHLGDALEAVSDSVVLIVIFSGIAAALHRVELERRRVEKALAGSEQRSRDLAAIVESSDDAIIGKGLDGTITTWNVGAERLYGWPSSEVIGQSEGLHIPPNRRDEMRVIMAKIRSGESIERLETIRLRKNGDPITVSLTVSPIRGAAGQVVGASSIARDITESKRLEESLRKAEGQYRLLFENSPHPMWVVDRETLHYVAVNDAAVEHYGYSREEFLAMDIGQIRPAEDVAKVLKAIPKEKAGLEKGIWRHVKKDGTLIFVEIATHALTFSDRSAWLVLAYDVTDRLKAEKSLRESEQRHRSLFESMLNGYAHCEMVFEDGEPRDFVYLDVNAAFEKMTGLTGVIGKRVTQIIPGIRESNPELFEIYGRVARTGAPEKVEIFLNALGIWLSISAYSPQKGQFVALFDNITERKRVEESLQKLLRAVEQAENVIFMTDPDGTITYVNPAFEKTYGYSREETLGKTPRMLKSGTQDRAYYERFWQRLLAGESVREEFVNRGRDGQLVTVEASVTPVLDAQKRRVGFIAVQQDVSDRKRSEDALRRSEERFSLAFHASPIPTCIGEIETSRILDANEWFLRIFGYSREEVIGKTSLELGIWADSGDRDRAEAHVRKEKAIQNQVTRIRTRSGEIREVVGSAVPIQLGGRKCALWTFVDVTERRRAEKEMHKSEERFRKLFESNTIGMVIADLDGRTLEANDAYLDMIGYGQEELQSGRLRWDQMTPAEYRERDHAAVEELRRTGAATPWEKELIRKDGSRVPILIGVAMLEASEASYIACIVDLSALRRVEEQFRQAQKMEAIGQLAGGVAHDFNNLLTAILGYAELLAEKLKDRPREAEDLDEIRKAGERAASLTRQLLAFSRRQVFERKVLDLNRLITEIEKMLRRLIGEDVDLVAALDPALAYVWADAGQLEQVVMNLAVNARDAMPRGGKLTIETSNVELDEAYARLHIPLRPGRYVMIAVSDTGVGMDAATRSRIFEPFFTTKERGKGTGLGLATVYGIVKQSGGYIWAYSEPGKGTTFKIYLPPAEQSLLPEEDRVGETLSVRGTETVLLVEDEESVRTLARAILESYGYRVLEAGCAQEAIETVRAYRQPIHLLLTDVIMPSMGGPDLASRVQTLRPDVKVLYMSGYTDEAVFRHGHLEQGRLFLQKPFTPEALAGKLRETLRA